MYNTALHKKITLKGVIAKHGSWAHLLRHTSHPLAAKDVNQCLNLVAVLYGYSGSRRVYSHLINRKH